MKKTTIQSTIGLIKKTEMLVGFVPLAIRAVDDTTDALLDAGLGDGTAKRISDYSHKERVLGETADHIGLVDLAVNPIRSMSVPTDVEKQLRDQAKAKAGGSKLREESIYKKLLNEWKDSQK